MNPTRRAFLRTAVSLSLGAGLAGCEDSLPRLWKRVGSDAPGPFVPPDETGRTIETHVLSRLTFGARPEDHSHIKETGIEAFIDEQLRPENIDDNACAWRVRRLESLRVPTGELFEYKSDFLLREVTAATMLRAVYSRRQLFEVMSEFWSDHFNIDSSKGDCRWLNTANDREVIRHHAMGRFSTLLRATATSPAMLWYLDGRVNQKMSPDDRPNENYARELLELHTMGVDGGYTQDDVMEVARCLTGWTVRHDTFVGRGRVEFRPEWHDDGAKRVLGHDIPAGLGAGDLDAVLDIVCAHPSTARFIATQLCRRFINDPPPASAVETVSTAFRSNDGDICATLRALFATAAFHENRDTAFKRPFHFVASALRATRADIRTMDGIYPYLLRMGHAPYQYPSPDGYPREAAPWMGTLMWRWHFAQALYENRVTGVRVDWAALRQQTQGDDGVMRILLGRRPTDAESRSYHASEAGPALLLAGPAFQRC